MGTRCVRIDLTGQTFGRLTVIEASGRTKHGSVLWRCRCVCGNETTVDGINLRWNNHTRSCGCLERENRIIHGHCGSGAYNSWEKMIQRCTNRKHFSYPRYGGANPPVTVCERWLKFENFFADMGDRPEGTTLGRILDMGNYEPGNCFWQTNAEQKLTGRNKRALLAFAQAA